MAWEAIALPLGDTRTERIISSGIRLHRSPTYATHGAHERSSERKKEPAWAGSVLLFLLLPMQRYLLGSANTADGRAAVGALALGDGLAILRGAFHWILHDLLSLALYAICFYRHE